MGVVELHAVEQIGFTAVFISDERGEYIRKTAAGLVAGRGIKSKERTLLLERRYDIISSMWKSDKIELSEKSERCLLTAGQ